MEKLWCNDSIAATASWVAPVELPEDDYVLIKPFGVFNARIPGGTVLKRIKHAWQSANTVDNADGVGEEYYAYVVLAPSNSQHWLLNRTDLANGMVQKLQGLDPIMQAAVRNGVPSDLRTFATVTGLRKLAPNDTVEVVLSQVSIPDNVLVFPVLVLAYLWVVVRVILDFVTSKWRPARWEAGLGVVAVHAPPGRALARDGGTWMRSAALEGFLVLIYETADEAFSPEAIRWQLTMVLGLSGIF